MTVNADLRNLLGGSAGNHVLGTTLKEAGVSVSGGVYTFDTTQAHRMSPLGNGDANPNPPAGYTKLAFVFQSRFVACLDSAAHKLLGWSAVASTVADAIKITESAAGVWTFTVGGVGIGTYTPSAATTYHVEIYVSQVTSAGTHLSTWAIGANLWVTVLVDKTVLYNVNVTALIGNCEPARGVPVFGESGATGTGTFKVSHVACGYSDRANPIGKITVSQWTWRLGITPPAGNDGATKSTGTDGAAVIDEVPPAGSGTTDVDYLQFVDAGANIYQVNALAQNILGAGDILYAVINKSWARTNTSSKITAIGAALHDGTNRVLKGGGALTGPTSYAETTFGNPGCALWNTAPDAAAWSGKANAYLNGCFAGTYLITITSTANMLVDATIIETAIVKNGDAISALADPPVLIGMMVAATVQTNQPVFEKTRVIGV